MFYLVILFLHLILILLSKCFSSVEDSSRDADVSDLDSSTDNTDIIPVSSTDSEEPHAFSGKKD